MSPHNSCESQAIINTAKRKRTPALSPDDPSPVRKNHKELLTHIKDIPALKDGIKEK